MINYSLTDIQRDIIVKNIHHYYTPGGDPHQRLAEALNVPRQEAKHLLYKFLWTHDSLFTSMYRKDSFNVMFLANKVEGYRGRKRELYDEMWKHSDQREEARRLRRVNADIIRQSQENQA